MPRSGRKPSQTSRLTLSKGDQVRLFVADPSSLEARDA